MNKTNNNYDKSIFSLELQMLKSLRRGSTRPANGEEISTTQISGTVQGKFLTRPRDLSLTDKSVIYQSNKDFHVFQRKETTLICPKRYNLRGKCIK